MSQPPLITTPTWMVVIRGFQFFLAIIILGLSGAIIHYVYMGELGLSVAMVQHPLLLKDPPSIPRNKPLTPTSPSSPG